MVAAFMLMEMFFGTGVLWQLSLLAFEFESIIHNWNSCLNLGALLTVSIVSFCLCCLHAIVKYNFYGWLAIF